MTHPSRRISEGLPWLAALALHATLGLPLLRIQSPPPLPRSAQTIELLEHAPASGGPRAPERRLLPPTLRTPSRRSDRPRSSAVGGTGPSSARHDVGIPLSPGGSSPGPGAGVDLFPDSVLRRYGGEPSISPGRDLVPGTSREDRSTASSARSDEGRLVRERIQGWLDEGTARERVRSGRVAPRWRQIERRLQAAFQPPLDLVRRESRALSLVKQILLAPSRVQSAPASRGDPPRHALEGVPEGWNLRSLPDQQRQAVQDAWEEPASWLRTEVDLTMHASGEVGSVRIVRSSGKRALDEVAERAVREAAQGDGPIRGLSGDVVTRWVVESSVAVAPPDRMGFRFDETGMGRGKGSGLGRYVGDVNYVLRQKVRTRVALLSLTPGDPEGR